MMKDDKPTLCGYHYYMSPETAIMGLENLRKLKGTKHEPIATNKNYDDVSHI